MITLITLLGLAAVAGAVLLTFAVAVALFHLTLGRANIDNLFAVAQR